MVHAFAENDERLSQKNRVATSEPSTLKEIVSLLVKIVIIAIIFLLIFTFIFGFFRNTDISMNPSIRDGDLVIYYRLDKFYAAQDTIVLEYEGEKQVRRIIATAGDTVDITEEGLLVNGALQQEPDIYFDTQRYDNGVKFPMTLTENQIFVLGDRRVDATDSRVYGAVNIDDTLGKVMTILRRRNI